ncbi:hypothetical protein cypCar_00046688 [Cyprinus carpio]|nr:hypothetical protein cypCar_00046688 [Cyprinus carpio]
MRISIASEDKRTIGISGNEPKTTEVVGVGEKRCESLTETQGLDVALGVGDRCTVTNAIQAPVNGHLRETGSGETDIIVSEDISRSSSVATALPRFLSVTVLRMRRNRQLSRLSGLTGLKPWLTTSVGESLQKEAVKKKMMKQTRLEMQKAIEEDSTVYEYDSVYDDIQKERLESNKKLLGGTERKPKYINQLLRAVEERKKEQERRDERKIQKEREAEGEMFADKEAFVTTAYRQKLKERQEELEREKREAELEAALDVKKQKDLSGFYRHLLNQTVGEEAVPDRSAQR